MPRRATKSTADVAITEESVVATEKSVVENEKKEVIEPLKDSDEIEVISLSSNVSYEDNHTGDMYVWEEIGHSEYMTVEVLKNMWRNHKGYFKNLLIKPMDKRVIDKFGLKSTYENYEYLMDGSNYKRENINQICSSIKKTPNGLKFSIFNKIKDMVVNNDLTDVQIIRTLEKQLDVDLIPFL